MSITSKIEWTEATWNPVTGCRKVSPACKNCYAETFANRFKGVKGHPYENGFSIKLRPERLLYPLKWKSPKMIFVNSMSDLFLKEISDAYIKKVFEVMSNVRRHTFQVLTKRDSRMLEWTSQRYSSKNINGKLSWPNNVWLGVSVETANYVDRIRTLKKTPAKVKFISFEPVLADIKPTDSLLKGIDWVIVGGESGRRARPMNIKWVENIFNVCKRNNIPFFFKQWGEFNSKGIRVGKKEAGRKFKGKKWNEMPRLEL